MRSAIPLARNSTSTDSDDHTPHGTVLSIGPFGATLSPSQEYGGVYPAPYGPTSSSSNAFTDESARQEAITALTQFHLSRLLTFSEDAETWAQIEWIAFETIPLLTEYAAVRRAMGEMHRLGKGRKFWISSAWPQGHHPQQSGKGSGEYVSVREVVQAALGGEEVPADAVGLNCTNPSFIKDLSERYTEAIVSLRKEGVVGGSDTTFVLYPDGGSVYDTVTRKWTLGDLDPSSWGRQVSAVARGVEEKEEGGKKVWSGVIVGGCCKAGFEEIQSLSSALRQ